MMLNLNSKKPIIVHIYSNGTQIKIIECPNCYKVLNEKRKVKCCSECKQKLDWK